MMTVKNRGNKKRQRHGVEQSKLQDSRNLTTWVTATATEQPRQEVQSMRYNGKNTRIVCYNNHSNHNKAGVGVAGGGAGGGGGGAGGGDGGGGGGGRGHRRRGLDSE